MFVLRLAAAVIALSVLGVAIGFTGAVVFTYVMLGVQ